MHLTQPAMQARFGRAERDADRRCDIGQREVEIVVQDDERPRFRLELRKGALELVAVNDRRRAVRDGRRGDRIDPDVESVSAETARFVDARSNDEAPCPGVEAIRIPKGGQITPDPDERVLDGVLSLFGVTEDEVGDGSQLGDRGACQLSEGVMIAPLRSLHEVSLHLAPWRWRGHLAVLAEYGEASSRVRSVFLVQPHAR